MSESPATENPAVVASPTAISDAEKARDDTNGSPTPSPSSNEKSASNVSSQIRLAVALALPVFLETLDYTVVATAQPHIASAFNHLDLQSYIGTVYVLTSTIFLPIFASLADIFGRHWALQLSMLFFLLGSAISTGAKNIAMVLAGRGIAGIGAAGLITIVRIILSDSRSLNSNNIQSAMLVILYAVGFSTGPSIGGALTTISFRWVFAINLPCTVLSMVLAFFLLPGHVKPAQVRNQPADSDPGSIMEKFQRIDVVGALLFIGGGILLLLGLNWGSTESWNESKVITSLVISGLLIIAFIFWEWFVETPLSDEVDSEAEKARPSSRPSWLRPETMIPLEIFKNYDVCATQLAAFSSGMVMLVNLYFLAIFFTIVLNKPPNQAGVQLIYFAPGMGVGTFISIFLIKYLRQPKIPIIIGSFLVPVSLGLLSLAMQRNNQGLADAFLVVSGAGIGLTFGPLATQARFSQPENRVAIVTSLNLFFRTFGGTVGLAQCSAVMNAKVRQILTDLARSGTLTPLEIAQVASLGDVSSIQAISGLPPPLQQAVRDAFREGVRWAFISLVPWTALAAISVLFLSKIPDTDLARQSESGALANGAVTDNGEIQGQPSSSTGENPSDQSGRRDARPKIYGPVSLIIYLVRRYRGRRREEQDRARVA